jgi:thiol-disulfide isomerase/thioredoxin
MNLMGRGFLFFVVALGALALGYYARTTTETPGTTASNRDAAQVLLAATLEDLDGKPQPIAQWRGKVLVVNFWATWCPPCLKEIPDFVRLQTRYGDQGVLFVGIAIDERAKVADFVTKFEMNYPVLMAQQEGLTLARDAGNRMGGLPFTVIIDRHGRTNKVELGVLDEAKLEPILQELLR